jgi:predicted TIM-barrel fold metal-dependent hydrolase
VTLGVLEDKTQGRGVTTFSDQPGIKMIGEVAQEADIPLSVEKTNPDVVIIAQDKLGMRPGICDTVLRQRPEVRVIAIAPHHNYSVYYWESINIHSRDVEASEEASRGVLRIKGGSICSLT